MINDGPLLPLLKCFLIRLTPGTFPLTLGRDFDDVLLLTMTSYDPENNIIILNYSY